MLEVSPAFEHLTLSSCLTWIEPSWNGFGADLVQNLFQGPLQSGLAIVFSSGARHQTRALFMSSMLLLRLFLKLHASSVLELPCVSQLQLLYGNIYQWTFKVLI